MSSSSSDAEKNLGNEAFKSSNFRKAIEHFTNAINTSDDDKFLLVCYSNRSASFLKLNMFEESIKDARKCKELDPRFVKGYIREIESLHGKGKFKEAIEVCKAGLLIDPDDRSLQSKKRQLEDLLRTSNGSFLQSVLRYLRLFLFVNMLCYVLPFGLSQGAYSRTLYSEVALNLVALYSSYGLPQQFSTAGFKEYLQKLDYGLFMKLFYAVLLIFGRPYVMALLPILLTQLTNVTSDIFKWIQMQLPILEPKVAPLLRTYAPQFQYQQLTQIFSPNQVNNFNFQLVRLAAYTEVLQGVYFIVEIILPTRNLMFTMLFWQFLQMRYITDKSGHIKAAFVELDGQIMKLLSYKFVPSIALTLYSKLKVFLYNKVSMSQDPSRNSNSSMLSKCTIM